MDLNSGIDFYRACEIRGFKLEEAPDMRPMDCMGKKIGELRPYIVRDKKNNVIGLPMDADEMILFLNAHSVVNDGHMDEFLSAAYSKK